MVSDLNTSASSEHDSGSLNIEDAGHLARSSSYCVLFGGHVGNKYLWGDCGVRPEVFLKTTRTAFTSLCDRIRAVLTTLK